MTAPLTVYRRSELEAVDDGCLYRYQKIWREGVDDTSDVSLIGIAFHQINYHYIQALVDAKLEQDAELAKEAFVTGIATAKTPSYLIPEVHQVWSWHAERFELPLEQFVTAEEKQSSGAVSFTPDLVTASPAINELEVHDFKSGWHPPLSEDELRKLFQARVYVFYAMQRWPGFDKYRFTLHAVRFNKLVSVAFTDRDLDALEAELTAHIATIEQCKETDEWPAVAGPACHFCQLQCPITDQEITVPKRLIERRQAEILGAWILAGEQMLRQAKKALKGFVSSHGPVDVHGIEWANRPIIGKRYPANVVVSELTKINAVGGLDPTADLDLTISHSALRPYFKQFPALEEELAPAAIEKESWRFSAKKPGTEEPETGESE